MDMNSFAFRPPGAFDEGEPLHPLDWAGLLARLGAERDLRRELSSRVGSLPGGASFSHGAAWALDGARPEGEPPVNPDGLADFKSTEGISPAAGDQPPAAGSDARGQT